jgi:CelD/BcsL family acetyltransferase involved in cellulose biosynthesis
VIVDQIKHSPFVTEEFLELVVQLEDRVDGDVHSEFYSVKNGLLSNKGSRDYVDYRPSLKLTPQLLEDLQCKIASLDSLHFSQIQEITDAFTNTSVKIMKGDQAVNLVLPETYDKYLIELPRKKRHELKRKKSRFESLHPNGVLKESNSDDVFDVFVELHKTSEGEKGAFMKHDVIEFFRNLLTLNGWKIYYLEEGTTILACCFVFEDEKGCYLYNSSKNNNFNDINPGIIIIDKIIEKLISNKHVFFDFLKGTERYKFDLGGTSTQLYDIQVNL